MAYEDGGYKKWFPQTSWEAPSLKAMVSARIKKEYTTKTEDWQYKRQESKEEQIYEENGSVGFGDYDAGELGKRSECNRI